MGTAHRRIEHFDIEEFPDALLEPVEHPLRDLIVGRPLRTELVRFCVLGLAFVGVPPLRLAQTRQAGLELLVQQRTHGVGDDVLDDMLRSEIRARALALLVRGDQRDPQIAAAKAPFPVVLRDHDVVHQQPFVDRAQLADTQRAIVHEDQLLGLGVVVARQEIDGASQEVVGHAILLQETGRVRLTGLVATFRRQAKQSAVVRRDVVFAAPFRNDLKQLSQPQPQVRVGLGVSTLQPALHRVGILAGGLRHVLFEPR